MTDDTVNTGGDTSLVDMENLDTFSSTFFGKEEAKPAPVEVAKEDDEAPENEDDTLATKTDEDASGDEKPDEDDEPEDKDEEPVKPVKKSAQERINEVVAKQRAVERERDALAARIRELEAATTKKPEVEQKPSDQTRLRVEADENAPSPDALDEEGNPKYRLGEFDPQFIRDLTRHTIEVEHKAAKEAEAQEQQRKMVEAAQAELTGSWLQKVEETEKELPDLREKIGEMEVAFAGIDPGYGEFLAGTIMACENGPQIMYYLSQNIGEAQKIVASGPAAATLALGRLDAKFVKATEQEAKRNKKPSSAPEPAPTNTRGQGGRFSTPGDTNDLSAFEKEYFSKK